MWVTPPLFFTAVSYSIIFWVRKNTKHSAYFNIIWKHHYTAFCCHCVEGHLIHQHISHFRFKTVSSRSTWEISLLKNKDQGLLKRGKEKEKMSNKRNTLLSKDTTKLYAINSSPEYLKKKKLLLNLGILWRTGHDGYWTSRQLWDVKFHVWK